MDLGLTSVAFSQDEPIPARFTCDGLNISPPLSWNRAARATRSFAIICEDLDAPSGALVHWLLYNLPPGVTSLPEAIPNSETLINHANQGLNDFQRIGYSGPCPHRQEGAHRYSFRIYALDRRLPLTGGASVQQVMQPMKGHIIGAAELVCTYERQSQTATAAND